ncbi:hypothetical protein GGQ18_002985 [Salinibacter ruber]|uniref:sulfotransferase domain-containing protein n=1 Tax=Salinibacter ruber TaxID=146919 RepID=UPI00161E3CE4|nr:sulfotransferase domain-containing protein [Salinibacter ruber]MBB4070376.1 hypothetical protein [Salinibacter ruber]
MENCFVHIGGAKCASSYIRSSILSKLKKAKYYERGGEVCELVKKYCTGKENAKPCWGEGVTEKVVISHEGLSIYEGKKGEIAKRLRDILPKAKIIYVIREQRDWLSSRYSQDLKNYMGVRTKYYRFKDWLEGKLHKELSKSNPTSIYYRPVERVKYDKILESYMSQFEEVKIFKYENLKREERFVQKICKYIGEENISEDVKKSEKINKRDSLYKEIIQKKMAGIKGHKRISKLMSRVMPYKKPDRRELVPERYLSVFRDTNESLKSMGIELTDEYL